MPYCYECGVKLQQGVESCPLCNTVVPYNIQPIKKEEVYPKDLNIISMQEKHRNHFLFVNFIGISSINLISISILALINLILNFSITWSFIPIISLFLVEFYAFAFLIIFRKIFFFSLTLSLAHMMYFILLFYHINASISNAIMSSVVAVYIFTAFFATRMYYKKKKNTVGIYVRVASLFFFFLCFGLTGLNYIINIFYFEINELSTWGYIMLIVFTPWWIVLWIIALIYKKKKAFFDRNLHF